jgi:2,3-bisphosphoglycerate-dependent phosphoglycerate mutase
MKRALLATGLLAAAGYLGFPAAGLAQKALYVVRHAEKASDANESSVPLSAEGIARAQRLAALLKDSGVSAIYSTDTVRTRKTAEPLAAARKLEVGIYDPTGPDGKVSLTVLAEKLRRDNAKDVVLVVGHSNTIAPLLSALGCTESVSIGGNEYDNLFVVVPRAEGPSVLLRLRY